MKIISFVLFFIMFFAFSCTSTKKEEGCSGDKDCDTKTQICISSKCISNSFLCDGKTCSNNGQCIVVDGYAACDCNEGFIAEGLTCVDAPCVKDSECSSNMICKEGECLDENILCNDITCSGSGDCVILNKEAKCNCRDGYINGENKLTCIQDKCKDVECSVIEMCNNNTGNCEIVRNPCDGIDCGNWGECIYDVDGIASCECDEAYIEENQKCVFDVVCIKTADIDNCDDGLDNNCDGIINPSCNCDSGAEMDCYHGDTSKVGIGECKQGRIYCIGGESWGECDGEVLVSEEICDNKDNDCDGKVDLDTNGNPLVKDCYSRNIEETQHNNSRCKPGKYECKSGDYDIVNCIDEILPLEAEVCGNSIDDNCNGLIDEDCMAPTVTCSNNVTRAYIFESPVNLSAEAVDSNGTVVSTSWSFFTKPTGTASILNPTTGNRSSFIPDTVGEYIVRFTATDNDGEKSYCDIKVNAATRDHLNVTLTWDKGGRSDMDLHLLKPGVDSSKWNTVNDCFWSIANPNWGDENSNLDDPHLDRDDTDGFGPEVIQIQRPIDGKYTVAVDYFDDQNEGASIAIIKIICKGEEFIYTSNPINSREKWTVVDIVWANEGCTIEDASREYQ